VLLREVFPLEKSGIHTIEYEPPLPEEALLQVKEVSEEWLEIPGRSERGLTLGRFRPNYVRSTPLFTAVDSDQRVLASVNKVTSYRKGETTIDLIRHRIDAPNGVMDHLLVRLFLHEKERGFQHFTLGMAPMAGFQKKEEASPAERAVRHFFQHFNFLFSYKELRQYKAKFATFWEPRYVIYQKVLDLPRLALALGKISELGS
jgi:phosphatidylglycerol lysyltransferase